MTRPVPLPALPWHRGALALGAVLALATAGCSGGDGSAGTARRDRGTATVPTTADASAPSTVDPGAPGASDPVGTGPDATAPASPGTSTRRTAPTTTLLPAGTDVPSDPPTNSKGVPISLDETALLACAQNQFAWVARREARVDDAAAALRIAAERARVSSVPGVSSRADALAAAAAGERTDATVTSFLDLCETNGFEY